MKYSEFKKQVEGLSSGYMVERDDSGDVGVCYKNVLILYVPGGVQFDFSSYELSDSMPFSHKLYMLAAELAMTPIEKRADTTRYYVQVIKGVVDGYLNVHRNNHKFLFIGDAMGAPFGNLPLQKQKSRN